MLDFHSLLTNTAFRLDFWLKPLHELPDELVDERLRLSLEVIKVKELCLASKFEDGIEKAHQVESRLAGKDFIPLKVILANCRSEALDQQGKIQEGLERHLEFASLTSDGPMFFGMTDRITDISVKEFTKYLIIRMRGVPSLDSSGMNALENLYDYCKENGVKLIFSHANEQPVKTMRRAGFVDLVGEEHFRPNIDDTITHARELITAEDATKGAKAAA